MSNATSLVYYNERIQLSQPRVLRLLYTITGAVTVTDALRSGTLTTFGAIAAQSTIDTYLGTSSEFDYLAFDATSMGNDAMGVIVNMGGQVAEVYQMVARCYSASNTVVTRQVEDSSALTATSLTTEIAKGSSGNVALKVDWGNTPDFDALTAGTIDIQVYWRAK